MKSSEQILFLLKTRGPSSTQALASALAITSMGARRQLEAAHEKGLVSFDEVADKVGRPSRRWVLTAAGHARFPDRHADLTVQLILQARSVFGEAGLDQLIAARDQAIEANYRMEVADQPDLAAKVDALARLRDAEGYMAETEQCADGSVLLVENHCPICAAARECQNFCRAELAIFQRVLGDECQVERAEHLLSGGRRCVYRIRPASSG
ncbi:metalloregulator ArsR/SmtB family transcription factor [Massilia sp. CF038]|uniref:helix-turn-helix transcriptional regulator n=1 Tax=Massilia sp. CF038 TaxID=1881045 RepID=UPI00092001BD|nr:metalloregulator ArsR/SmtB family transcription factor [Massilia sp. CF038]SHH20847.1 Predicted transcriptional regulator, ArsR family [Massilia sp. CF038]